MRYMKKRNHVTTFFFSLLLHNYQLPLDIHIHTTYLLSIWMTSTDLHLWPLFPGWWRYLHHLRRWWRYLHHLRGRADGDNIFFTTTQNNEHSIITYYRTGTVQTQMRPAYHNITHKPANADRILCSTM